MLITTNWKILQELGIPDHLTCLLKICMQVKKQQLELDMEQLTGSKLGKEYIKVVYCQPAHLTYMQSTLYKMLGWMKHKLESRLPGEISITSDMQMTPPLWQKAEELKSFLMKVKEESEKVGLKFSLQKTKIMASGPITSWQTDGETTGIVSDSIFLGSKITAGGDCSHEIKRCLLLGRKAMTILDSILKSWDISLLTKVCLFKVGFFSSHVWMWVGIKKAECWRIDAFELCCWKRLLRVPWTARRSNQSILKEISPEYSLEGLTLKMKFQHFGHLMQRTDSLEKTLMLAKIEGRKRRGWQRMRWWDGITD